MIRSRGLRSAWAGVLFGLICWMGCSKPQGPSAPATGDRGGPAADTADRKSTDGAQPSAGAAQVATAAAADVAAATKRLDTLGKAKYKLQPGGVLTDIVVPDGSPLTAEDITLFGKLTDLRTLQIYNCREMNDEMAAHLAGLKELTTLAITNSVINDPTVEMIVKAFPNLTDLDLSSNTNMTGSMLKVICTLSKLQRLTLVQDRFSDLGTRRLAQLPELRFLDLRGNMEAADMTMKVVAELPKLVGFKHRSTAVTDAGIENLSQSKTLESVLMQDFVMTDLAGQHIAKLKTLTQLEIFRCQGFGSNGVLALKGMGLERLTLRDLPMVNDQALEVFTDLPKLQRLYLHEIASVSDSGLKNLAALKSLEVLDIWTIPQMTDATVDVIATLPKLRELSIRTTGVTDATVDKLRGMQNLQSLTFKDNGAVTADALQKLTSRKWSKLDIGSGPAAASE
jgi:hypothetical protein